MAMILNGRVLRWHVMIHSACCWNEQDVKEWIHDNRLSKHLYVMQKEQVLAASLFLTLTEHECLKYLHMSYVDAHHFMIAMRKLWHRTVHAQCTRHRPLVYELNKMLQEHLNISC